MSEQRLEYGQLVNRSEGCLSPRYVGRGKPSYSGHNLPLPSTIWFKPGFDGSFGSDLIIVGHPYSLGNSAAVTAGTNEILFPQIPETGPSA